ncbi:MAG: response regulator [Pseudomonadota bacterium]
MTSSAQILLVEDDPELRPLTADFLSREGFEVEAVADGTAMDRALTATSFDLLVLDLMLPGEDGLSICRRIRARSAIPILMLTARKEEIDRIIGLELGADDYLGKPFNPRELTARIRAILRRTSGSAEPHREILAFDIWQVDPTTRTVRRDGEECVLTSGEYELLEVLVTHANRVLSRDWLLDRTQGRTADPFDRSIDVQISRLRRKLGDNPRSPHLIKTVRNGGYIFAAKVQRR